MSVGAATLLLMLSFEESHFWLEYGLDLFHQLQGFGELATLSLFGLAAYGLGAIFIEFMPRRLDWGNLIGHSLTFENSQLLAIVLEEKARADLFVGLGRAFSVLSFLGLYNFTHFVIAALSNVQNGTNSSLTQLIFSVLFGGFMAWQLPKFAVGPFENSKRLVEICSAKLGNKEVETVSTKVSTT